MIFSRPRSMSACTCDRIARSPSSSRIWPVSVRIVTSPVSRSAIVSLDSGIGPSIIGPIRCFGHIIIIMSPTFPNLIDGRRVESIDRNTDINPSNTGDIVGEFARASRNDLADAIAAARNAFGPWSRSNIQQRFDVLDKAGTEILARREELGRQLAREQGKPLADGI